VTEIQGLLAQLARSMGPGAELGGDRVRLEQDPGNGLELRLTLLDDAGEPTSVASVFSATDEPPLAFPADLPFLPGAVTHVIEDRGRGTLLASWRVEEGSEPGGSLDRVVRGCREAGWRLEAEPVGLAARLRRAGRRRRVEVQTSAAGAVVALAERPDPEDQD
jgi:hypothetical protein